MPSQPNGKLEGRALDVLVRLLHDAVVLVDHRGRVLLTNRAEELPVAKPPAVRMTDLGDVFHVFHADGRPYETAEWPALRSLKTGEAIAHEEFFRLAEDGSRRTFSCNSAPVLDDQGRVAGAVLVAREITQQKRSRERLLYLLPMLDHSEDGIIGFDAEWHVTAWNKGAERMYGWTAEEALGRPATLVRLGESDEQREERRSELAERGCWRGEIKVTRKDGSKFPVEVIDVAIRDRPGQITGYLGIHRDITERKRAEAALKESSRRSTDILESITDAFVALDSEWRYTYVNERAVARVSKAWGREVSAGELLGKNCWELFPEQLGSTMDRELHRALREQEVVEFQTYSALTDSWLETRAYPSQDGLSVYSRDISEHKQAKDALREANRRSEAILESITDAFVAVDREWRYTYLNDRALRSTQEWLGWPISREELLGRSLWEVFPETVGTVPYVKYHQAVRDGRAVEFETYFAAHDSWFETHVYPSETGLSIYFRTITERKRAEQQRELIARQQALVAELGQRALAGDDLQPLMDEAVGLVARTLGVELAEVAEVVAGSEKVILRAGVGWAEGVVGSEVQRGGRASQVGYTLMRGEPVIALDQTADPRFKPGVLTQAHGVVSALSVMIASPDEPFGVLAALSTTRRTFSPSDVSFVQAVANVLASAVERSRAQARLTEVRETERRRIARDLHDHALRDLTDALVVAGATRSVSDKREAVSRLERLRPVLTHVGEQLRGAIYGLRLSDDEDRPFPELLQALVDVERAMALDGEVELALGDGVPAGPMGAPGTEILRVLGEALTNARRHSDARHVRVRVWSSERKLYAEVADDGHGFDPAVASTVANGTGIKGMRERAELIHGDLAIRSEPGIGTRVRIEVPLARDAEERAEPVRVLLVEDHAAVRQAIASAFQRDAGFEVVGEAASLAEARGLLNDVDVALLDLGLPDGYGTDLIKELRTVSPSAQTLVLSAAVDRAEIARAVQSGAAGVISKTRDLDDVVDAVRRLSAGETLLPLDEILELLRFASREGERELDERRALAGLTPREREILQALAEGLDSRRIADRFHISIHTARNHINNMCAKLGVHSQLQAVVLALRYGIVEIKEGRPSAARLRGD